MNRSKDPRYGAMGETSPAHAGRALPLGRTLAAAVLVAAAGSSYAASLTRTSAFDYDAATGLLVKEIIEPGDSSLCLVTTYGYDVWGHKNSTTTRNCNGSSGSSPGNNGEAAAPAAGSQALFPARTSTAAYTADGRFPLTNTNALGHTETQTFHGTLGVLTQLTGPNGLTSSWKYDEWGRKVLEKRADGNGTSWTYQYCSGVLVNGVAGSATCPTIAGAMAVYVVTSTPVKAPIDLTAGTTGGAAGAFSKVYHDALGRVIRTETQGWDGSTVRLLYQDTEYNHLGRATRSSRPYFAGTTPVWVATEYDWVGRPVKVTQPDGSKSTSVYQGLSITVTDDLLRSTTQKRDVAGQLVEVTDPHGKTLRNTYDPYGNLLTTVDSLGNVTRLHYDARGRKDSMVDPDMGTWTYGYNALGEMTRQTDAKAQVTQMTYDLLGRLTAKAQPSLVTNWYYDKYQDNSVCNKGIGALCEATAANGYRRKNYFDNFGRASSTATTIGGTTYTSSVSYTAEGRPETVTYPGGALAVKNQYTSLGVLQQVVNASNPATVYWKLNALDAAGHITSQTYGNNVTTQVYDALTGRLTQTLAGPGNSVQNLSYAYDTVGNLKTRTDLVTGVSASYTYDSLNRIKTEARQGGGVPTTQTVTWVYDDLGNISSRSDVGTYAYNPSGAGSVRPHAVSAITGTVNGQGNPSYTYDANGNLAKTSVGATTLSSVTWNSYNKVDSISRTIAGTTSKLDFLYDSEGERVREVYSKNGATQRTTVYLNGGGLLYEEETIGGVTSKKHYLNSPSGTIGQLTLSGGSWTTQYWHKDHLGSTSVITDAAGAVVSRMAYEPFGKRRNANGTTDPNGSLTVAGTRRGFTGHEHDDEVGLINMNGRIFDPAIGRFLSADPTLQAPTYMQSYNRYAYLWNSPLNGTDPSGYQNFFTTMDHLHERVVSISMGVVSGPEVGYGVFKALTGKYGYQIKSMANTVGSAYCGWWQYVCLAAGQGSLAKAYGASDRDAIKAAAIAAATAYAMNTVGNLTSNADGSAMSMEQAAANTAGHAAVGCASSAASGGDCKSGALSGGFSAAFANFAPQMSNDFTVGLAQSMVVGGIGSVIGGGKFANGAITGAFGYLYNRCMHGPSCWQEVQAQVAQVWSETAITGSKTGLSILGFVVVPEATVVKPLMPEMLSVPMATQQVGKEIIQWGSGPGGALKAVEAMTPERARAILQQVDIVDVRRIRDWYAQVAQFTKSVGNNVSTPAARAELMRRIEEMAKLK